MNHLRKLLAGLLAAAAVPSAASAADWWWVAGEPGGDDVWFVDASTIMAKGGETSFSQLHLTRNGASDSATMEKTSCDEANADPVRRFVCATPEQRMSLGAMLGSIPPAVSARIIFDAPPQAQPKGIAAN